jgi:hypothetical protein
VIPQGVEENWIMFRGTPYLNQIPGELQIIDHKILRYRGTASEVVIPPGMNAIGGFAFFGCSSLQ